MKKRFNFTDNIYPFNYIDHTRITVRAVLINHNEDVALNHVVCDDLFGHRDCYELPGGGKKKQESLHTALKREILEETGYEVDIISPLCIVEDYYNLIHRKNINHYYLVKARQYVGKQLEAYEKDVIQDFVFVDFDEAIRLMEASKDDGVGILVAQREVPVLKLAKEKLKQ